MTGRPSRVPGRVVAWAVVIVGVVCTLVQTVVPSVARIRGHLTWSRERLDACRLEPACLASDIPLDWLPWVGLVWVGVIAAAVLYSLDPRRWWIGPGRRRPRAPGVSSTPEWLRAMAYAALAINALGLVLVTKRGGGGVRETRGGIWLWEYFWPIGAAVAVAVLATWVVRVTADRLDPVTATLLRERADTFLLGRRERERRADRLEELV